MNRKILVLLVALLCVVTLAGCGAREEDYYGDYDPSSDVDTEPDAPEPVINEPEVEGGDVIQSNDLPAMLNRKIIYTAGLEMKTPDPEEMYNDVLDTLDGYTAYIETANIVSYQYVLKIRVLSSEFNDLVDDIKTEGDVVKFTKSSEDVTNSYSTYEARKSALETQHTRILDLIAAADNLDTILELEKTRIEIETELNYIGVELAKYDSLVEYSTINLTIKEATEEIVVVPRTPEPQVSYTEVGKDYIKIEVWNKSANPAKLYVDVYQNGEFIKEYESDAFGDSKAEFTIGELESNKEYTFKVTAMENDYQLSHDDKLVVETEKTFFNRVGNVFTDSFDMLIVVLEAFVLVITALIPFAVTGAIIVVPLVIWYKKRQKKYLASTPPTTSDTINGDEV